MHLDPRMPGVVVPAWLSNQAQLVLQVGLDMPIPITDLKVDDEGISGTLSFNRTPFTCIIGWDAVFALSGEDGQGMVWPESMPPEITAEVEREAGRRQPVPLTLDAEEEAFDGLSSDPGAEVFALTGERLSSRPSTASADGEDDEDAPIGAPRAEPASAAKAQTVKGRRLPPYLRVIK